MWLTLAAEIVPTKDATVVALAADLSVQMWRRLQEEVLGLPSSWGSRPRSPGR
jgi:hypothetical protein